MTLREKQHLFAQLVALLIQRAYISGFEVSLGNTTAPTTAVNSLHPRRLAIDINLFLDGVFLTETEDHAELGEWWEQQDPLCRWGGRFGDGNHYSMEHEGHK